MEFNIKRMRKTQVDSGDRDGLSGRGAKAE